MREGPKRAPVRRRRLETAVATCVFVLTSALFAAPVSAEIDFGHGHPEETCPHVHELDSVLARAVTPAVALGERQLPRPLLVDAAEPQVVTSETVQPNPIRGPPSSFLT